MCSIKVTKEDTNEKKKAIFHPIIPMLLLVVLVTVAVWFSWVNMLARGLV